MVNSSLRRFRLCSVLAAILFAGTAAQPQDAAKAETSGALPPGYSSSVTGGIHDFDFYSGAWTVHSKGLKARNAGSKEWNDFTSVTCVTPYLSGGANASEMYSPASGNSGLTLRTFDLEKKQWMVHYISNKTGTLDAGMFGGFDGTQGKFFGEDTDNGHPIKARVAWSVVDRDHVHWEQAFSYDNRTWETNCISDMTRADPATTCKDGHPKR